MKKLAALLCLGALTTGAFAQGLVTFANGPTTLISVTPKGGTSAAYAASAGQAYYFGLLTAATAAGPFSFAGAYATNTAGAGRLGPASNTQAIAGWAPQTTMFYEVAGWSASLGATFNASWLTGNFGASVPAGTFFGVSAVANGSSGGGSPVPAPALPLFGGAGLGGFNMNDVSTGTVPEPTSMALAGLGAAALLIFRRRK